MRNPLHMLAKRVAEFGHRRSPHWPMVRERWLFVHPTCAACGSARDVEVHHKLPYHLYPDRELDAHNLITLCETMGTEHHLNVGHRVGDKRSWHIFNPNIESDAAKLLASQTQAKP